MIIIGSTAIKHHFPDFPREPKDLDIIGNNIFSGTIQGSKIENLKNDVLSKIDHKGVCTHLPADDLYTLKISHMFWNINWDKHMFDIQFLKKKGCVLDKELFYELYDYWNTVHEKNKRSDLEMTAEDFFNNNLKSDYDHDYLHTLLNPVPAYTKVLIGEVEVSEEKFNQLSHKEKCDLVREEVYVMAFERYSNQQFQQAYSRMLKKFIISHAPLWEAIFIIENFIELHKPEYNFITKINSQLNPKNHE